MTNHWPWSAETDCDYDDAQGRPWSDTLPPETKTWRPNRLPPDDEKDDD